MVSDSLVFTLFMYSTVCVILQICLHTSICDRICENMPNCGFNNYVLAAVLYAYIILSLLRVFFGSCELLPLLSRLGKYGMPTSFGSLLTAVRKHVPRMHDTRKRSETLTLYGNNRIIYGLT